AGSQTAGMGGGSSLADKYTLHMNRCKCCPCVLGEAIYSAAAIGPAMQTLLSWQEQLQAVVPGMLDGPAWINIGSANLVLRLSHPSGGPFDPTPILTYNSFSPASSEFGYGWSAVPKQTLAVVTSGVDITDGQGTVQHFVSPDANNRYLPPPTTYDALSSSPK